MKSGDLAGREIVALGRATISLATSAIGTITTIFRTGDILQPSGANQIVVAFVSFEWSPVNFAVPEFTLFNIQGGTWALGVDLNHVGAGGGAFCPDVSSSAPFLRCQMPVYPKGTIFNVTYAGGPGSSVLPLVTAWGWSA